MPYLIAASHGYMTNVCAVVFVEEPLMQGLRGEGDEVSSAADDAVEVELDTATELPPSPQANP